MIFTARVSWFTVKFKKKLTAPWTPSISVSRISARALFLLLLLRLFVRIVDWEIENRQVREENGILFGADREYPSNICLSFKQITILNLQNLADFQVGKKIYRIFFFDNFWIWIWFLSFVKTNRFDIFDAIFDGTTLRIFILASIIGF